MVQELLVQAIQDADVARVEALLKAHPGGAARQGKSSPILTAVYHRRHEALRALLACNPDMDLYEAAATGAAERVASILATDRSSLNEPGRDGFPALALACFFGHIDIVRTMLALGANPNVQSTNALRVAPIHAAAANGNLAIGALVLAAGADPNARQQAGLTALHTAAMENREDWVDLLSKNGADPTIVSDGGDTPASLATKAGHDALAGTLRDAASARNVD